MSEYNNYTSPIESMDMVALRLNMPSFLTEAVKSNDLHKAAIEAGHRYDTSRFLLEDFSHQLAPVDLNLVLRGPKPPYRPKISDIKGVLLGFPRTEDLNVPDLPADEWWQDVFIEVRRDNKIAERLLFNSDGLFGYTSADDIVPNEMAELTHNLFRVKNQALRRPDISFRLIEKAIYEYELSPLKSDE